MESPARHDGTPQQPPPRIRPWVDGGFGAWLLVRLLSVAIPILLIGILMPAVSGRRTGPRPRVSLYVYLDASGTLVANSNVTGSEDVVAQAHYFVYTHQTGFPAQAATHAVHRLVLIPDDPTTSAASRAAVAAYLATHANDLTDRRARDLVPFAARIAVGDFTHTSYLTAGCVLNAVAFLGLLGFLLWCAVCARRAYRNAVCTARAAVGLCPNCGYETRDLATSTCPECGDDHAVSALNA